MGYGAEEGEDRQEGEDDHAEEVCEAFAEDEGDASAHAFAEVFFVHEGLDEFAYAAGTYGHAVAAEENKETAEAGHIDAGFTAEEVPFYFAEEKIYDDEADDEGKGGPGEGLENFEVSPGVGPDDEGGVNHHGKDAKPDGAAYNSILHEAGSALFAIRHPFAESPEEVCGVVGAGGGFGVILDTVESPFVVFEAFHGVVIQIDVGDFAGGWQGVSVYAVVVVLAGDFNAAGFEVFYGMV